MAELDSAAAEKSVILMEKLLGAIPSENKPSLNLSGGDLDFFKTGYDDSFLNRSQAK